MKITTTIRGASKKGMTAAELAAAVSAPGTNPDETPKVSTTVTGKVRSITLTRDGDSTEVAG